MQMDELTAQSLLNKGTRTDDGEFTIAIRCFGTEVAIVLPDVSCLDPLIPLLPPTWEPIGVDRTTQHTIEWAGGDPTSRAARDYLGIAASLASQAEYAIAEHSPLYVFVHAGVVEIDGCALLFPGESFVGKSTLVAALVQDGANYFSDEYAVITDEGLVIPYRRQIALRNSLFFPEGRTDLSALAPVMDEMLNGIPMNLVLFSTYKVKGEWSCTSLDRTSTLIELCKNTVGFRSRPDMSFNHLNRLLDRGSGHTCIRGEARETIDHIMGLLRQKH